MQSLLVSTDNSYVVSIGAGLLNECGALITNALEPCKAVIMTDSTVGPLYAAQVEESLTQAGFATSVFTFVAGEASKTLETFSAALEFLAHEQLVRTDCVVALGGGVVGDLAGFVAGCYLRGIPYVQLPTTLLAAVDSSVGGKTALDLTAGKNLAGLFWQPSAVVCDTSCLSTLPPEVFLDGVAEAIKTGIIDDEALFSLFEGGLDGIHDHLEDVIARCVACKARIVAADEREGGLRKTLNLGHTIGHAIEHCSGYALSHGHAVAIGIAMIARAAAAVGVCNPHDAKRIVQTLSAVGLPVQTEFSTEELMQAILHDKKRTGNSIALVLPEKIGSCCLHEVALAELPALIEAGRK